MFCAGDQMTAKGKAADALIRGRECFDRQAWGDAFANLVAADGASALEIEDLERLAHAAQLSGRDTESAELCARAHQECLGRGEIGRAVRYAFWLAFMLMNRGEMAQAGGWLARAQRLLDENERDCVERGYLLIPEALASLNGGEHEKAYGLFEQAGKIAARFHDPDLSGLSRLGRGSALVRLGEPGKGLSYFDEVMAAVTGQCRTSRPHKAQ